MIKRTLIVFDMDGVLIDVSGSYREAVRQAARLFFSRSEGFAQLPSPLFPLDDLARLKQSGRLNNDWDLTAQVLSLLVSGAGLPGGDLSYTAPPAVLPAFDVRPLSAFLLSTPSPLMDLWARHGRHRDPRVSAVYRGDVASGNIIKRLFQEIYLGPDLFSQVYGLSPCHWTKRGLIETERLLVGKGFLQALARDQLLAIATGRPLVEAEVPLTRFALQGLFAQVLTLDHCQAAEKKAFAQGGQLVPLSKPHPFMLNAIAQAQRGLFDKALYLGDMPDDMVTAVASEARFQGVGVLWSSLDRAETGKTLLRAGARYLLTEPADLIALLGRGG